MKPRRAKKKFEKLVLIVAGALIVVFAVFYFRHELRNFFSTNIQRLSSTIWRSGNKTADGFSSVPVAFKSKQSLFDDNRALSEKLRELEADLADRELLLRENAELKEILNRKPPEENFILAVVLSKPNRSLYDTLIIDLGATEGLVVGSRVFAYGDILIGQVAEVYDKTSKVRLFSTPQEKTEIVLPESNVFLEMIGRGGGNFEISIPRDLNVEVGTEVSSTGIRSYVLGKIEKIISDERDPVAKVLVQSPVNIFELKFVQIEI